MGNKNDRWSALSMKERADLIKLYVSNGITSLNDIKKGYNSFGPGGHIETDEYGYPADITPAVVEADYPRENEVWKRADASNADMVQRLRQGSSRVTIPDWEDTRRVATHKMVSAGNYAVGNVQNINGQLFDFTDPKHGFENPDRAAIDSAIKRGDYIKFDTEGDARYFAEHYKKHYNGFDEGGTIEPLYYDNTPIEPAVVKAFDSNEDYNRYYGEQFGKQIAKKRDKVANSIMCALEYTPFVGDGIDAANTIASINEGDYSQAAVLAGLALLPNAIESVGKVVTRPFKNARRLKRMKETYTGVRHIPDRNNPHITMDDNFPTYNGTIWSSETPEYARQWVYDTEGKVYKVLTDPSDLKMVETPTPNSGEYYPWNSLPYELKDGKLSSRPSMLVDSHVLPDLETAVKYKRGVEYGELSEKEIRELENNFLKGRANSGTDVTTDNIVEQSYIQGFDGVNFKRVYDGPSIKDGVIVDVPINETVLNPHVPHIVLPENKSKWSLLFKDLDDLTIKKFGGKL